MVCDLVDSTPLASQLDPEDLLAVLHAYQTMCADVIQRFGGQIAQHLGDGLLVYFGYPQAHDDDAQRAVWAGLGIVEALEPLNHRLAAGARGAPGTAGGHPYRAGGRGQSGRGKPSGRAGPGGYAPPGDPLARTGGAEYGGIE